MRLGEGSLGDSSQDSRRTAWSKSGIGYKKRAGRCWPHTLEHSLQPKPRILDMIQDAATAGLLPKQLFLVRLDAISEAATAVYLKTLSMAQRNPQLGCIRKNMQPRQRTSPGSKQFEGTVAQPSRIQLCERLSRTAVPHRTMRTQNSPAHHPRKAVSVHRSSKRSSRGCLTELG